MLEFASFRGEYQMEENIKKMKTMKTKLTKKTKMRLIGSAAALALGLSLGATSMNAFALTPTGEKYYADATTIQEAVENAAVVGDKIVREGLVLLKNNGVLPLGGEEWVSSFNNVSNMKEGFAKVGFKVNEVSSYGAAKDTSKFTPAELAKMNHYNKAAFVSLKATQSGGLVTKELEDNKLAGGETLKYADGSEFTHESLAYEKADKTKIHKHSLQMTDNEEGLLKYATDNFDKVIAVIFGGTTMEAGILEAMDEVDAVIYVGTNSPDVATFKALGDLIAGNYNPSGRTNDLWAWDFTASPTWYNDGNSGVQPKTEEERAAYAYEGHSICERFVTENGDYYYRRRNGGDDTNNDSGLISGLKYEESIYYGYRFYETEAAEEALDNNSSYKYENRVVYPFGYGLSYSDFEWEVVGTDLADWGKEQDAYTKDGQLTVSVKVTNKGAMAGKDVVQIYAHNPYYAGGIAKAAHTLVGFEKTPEIKPGMSAIVNIKVNIQDIAAFDWHDDNGNGHKTYELDANGKDNLHDAYAKYELRVMKNSHDYGDTAERKDGGRIENDPMVVTLADLQNDIILDKDDFSGNHVEALFQGDDLYNLLGYDRGSGKTLYEEGKMTILQRTDIAASKKSLENSTWPQFDTVADMTRSDEFYDHITAFSDYEADKFTEYTVDGEKYTDIDSYYKQTYPNGTATNEDDSEFPWAVSEAEWKAMGGEKWSQRDPDADLAELQKSEGWVWFRDMIGLDYDNPKWDTLLNELTFDEMKTFLCDGGYKTLALDAIGKVKARYMDGSSQIDIELERIGGDKNYNWPAEALNAGTWNKDLMFQRGNAGADIAHHSSVNDGMDGWYAPATNIHRTPFGQRASEYFAEDGYLAGHMAGSVAGGMEAKGIMCTIKHYALNENENHRQNVHTYVTEQAAREIYFKPFQIAMQEYGCSATMTSYNAIGEVHSSVNYPFMQSMTRDEWGFNGLSLTDALTPINAFMTTDMMFRSGSDLVLSQFASNITYMAPSGKYDVASKTVKIGDKVEKKEQTGSVAPGQPSVTTTVTAYTPDGSGAVSYTQWSSVRTAVKHILYAEANSRVARNGVDMSKYEAISGTKLDLQFKQGSSIKEPSEGPDDEEDDSASGGSGSGYSIAIKGIDVNDTTYEVVKGTLPEGVSLSTKGVLSGTPEESGLFNVTVKVQSFNWLDYTYEVALDIASEFEIDGDDITALKVGTAVDSEIYHRSFVVGKDYDTVVYEFVDGELPKGISVSADGKITGTALTAGNYKAIVLMTASKSEQNFAGANITTVTERYVTVDFNIAVATGYDDSAIKSEIDGVKTDVDSIKTDVGGVKSDVGAIKEELNKEDSGCGSVVGFAGATVAMAVVAPIAALAIMLRRKKEN